VPVYGVAPESFERGAVIGSVPTTGQPSPRSKVAQGPETVFVLSGGGNRGACQVGMLRALCERGIVPDLLVGTSIGALNAAFFAGQANLEGTYLAAEMWRQVAAGDIFPRSRLYGSLRFLGRREAAYPNEGLRRLVGEFLRFERLEDSPVPLVVVATRFDDGAEEWFSEGPALEAVLASAALPAVYPAIERAGSGYIDGGVVNNVPL